MDDVGIHRVQGKDEHALRGHAADRTWAGIIPSWRPRELVDVEREQRREVVLLVDRDRER